MKPAVVAQKVSKKYSRNRDAHRSYGVTDLFREVFGRHPALTLRADEFLAVDDVSFHLNQGESLAIVGRNGSGKTTLLKMMNGLTKLDAGTIVMDGRVQALISLGAGFNPALSGCDNVYNSASLMGMSAAETRSIFDEIVAFSELEEFIGSPVGTYSSGMAARLGFSVAVHLRPDILLVDEILAVGDYGFQNKCFIKMHELKASGVTVVLVTHNHTHAIQLCEKAMWLHEGRMRKIGATKAVVQDYLSFLDGETARRVEELEAAKRDTARRLARAENDETCDGVYGPIYDETDQVDDIRIEMLVNGTPSNHVRVHDKVEIHYGFRLKRKVRDLNVTLAFFRKEGLKMNALSTLNGDLLRDVHEGDVRCSVTIPDFNLNPGHYVLVMPVHEGKSYLYRDVVKEFAVIGGDKLTWELMDFRYAYRVEEPARHAKHVSFLE